MSDKETFEQGAVPDIVVGGSERIARACVCCESKQIKSSPAVLMPFVAHRALGWEPVVIDESWGLSTIKNGNAYSVCRSLWCTECGLLFLDIRFSPTELAQLYNDYRGEQYTSLREFYEPGYAVRNAALQPELNYVDRIEAFLAPHLKAPLSILDWGGDTGKNTPFKDQSEVFDIHDISSKDPVDGAKIVSRVEAFSRRYRLVVCSNVLEHIPYPANLLNDLKNTMDADSILYIDVPFEGLMRSHESDLHRLKKHWHEHVNFFSEKSLLKLLTLSGFEIVASATLRVCAAGVDLCICQFACKLRSV
jgi:hypothetical protein